MGTKIGVLAAGGDREFLQGLAGLLHGTGDFECLGMCTECDELEGLALTLRPRVILMDSRCTRDVPPAVLNRLRGLLPGLVVGLLDLEEGRPVYDRLAKKAGADLFVCKSRVEESMGRIREMVGEGLRYSLP
jgi:DNA-binding NarL/FixJ family response regulator